MSRDRRRIRQRGTSADREDQGQDIDTRSAEPQDEPRRRMLPHRTHRLPSKFKDYILDFKRR